MLNNRWNITVNWWLKSKCLIITSVSIMLFCLFFSCFLQLDWLYTSLIWNVNNMPSVAVHICFAFIPIVNHIEMHANCTQYHRFTFNLTKGTKRRVWKLPLNMPMISAMLWTTTKPPSLPQGAFFFSFILRPPWLRYSHTSLIYSSAPSCQPAAAATPKSQSLIYWCTCKDTARI